MKFGMECVKPIAMPIANHFKLSQIQSPQTGIFKA